MQHQRAVLRCGNDTCTCYVHTDPQFGGYCCRRCHWCHIRGSRGTWQHGRFCLRAVAPADMPRAEPTTPHNPYDWGREPQAAEGGASPNPEDHTDDAKDRTDGANPEDRPTNPEDT